MPVNFNPPALRRGEGDAFGGRGGRGGRGGTPPTPDPNRMTAAQVAEVVDQFLVSAGALMRVNDAGMDHGLIRAFRTAPTTLRRPSRRWCMRNDDYGRIERLMADGGEVKLEFNIVNQTYPRARPATTWWAKSQARIKRMKS